MRRPFCLCTLAVVAVISPYTLFAQNTVVKLPTANSSSGFVVSDSSDSTVLKVSGDGGWQLGGTYTVGAIPKEGSGVRVMWYPRKAAFRAGMVTSTQWDDSTVGSSSVAFGYNTRASGFKSAALGDEVTSTGIGALAIGNLTTASGQYSFAGGQNSTASGINAAAIGTQAIAGGSSAFAAGNSSEASGGSAMALGDHVVASGNWSSALGTYASTNSKNGACIISDASTTTTTTSSASNELTMRFDGGYRLFSNYNLSTGVTLASGGSSWSTVSDSTKKTDFLGADGEYFLQSLSHLKLGSWNYKSQDPEHFRHYGPMAQEIFRYFGKDMYGTIGNDTTLASADMDGIIMICLQALERRTDELRAALNQIQSDAVELSSLKSSVKHLEERLAVSEKSAESNNDHVTTTARSERER